VLSTVPIDHSYGCHNREVGDVSGFDFDDPASFDPAQLSDVEDPYPMFDALREEGASLDTRSGYHVVTGYDAAERVLRDTRFSSGKIGEYFRAALPEGAAQERLGNRINFMDPPDHTRVRGLVVKAFTPQRVEKLRDWTESKAHELLDDVESRFEDGEHVDIRTAFAHELPSSVISEMLGVPVADRDQLAEWTETITPLLNMQADRETRERAIDASEKFADYASDLIAERRENPGDDLLSDMIHVGEGQESLSREELLSLFMTLYAAGHRTTRDMFSNNLYELLSHPEAYAAIANDPELVSGAVQEFLRYETPTLYVGRIPTEDVELDGTTVDAQTPTLIMLGAANRDPETFTDPHRFDIRRDGPDPLSFASGRHRCLGAPLATMEAEVMLEAVTERFPTLELAQPEPDWWNTGPFRGLNYLRVRPG
jgi:pimeloyl-[acyl-carrier protein] synthase